nr:amino acid adenylation domain-containing protein [Clostridium sp. CF011]
MIKNIYPLSPMQEGMLFHKLLGNDKNAYFEQSSSKIIGSLEVELFEISINKLIERYDVLRTLFIYEDKKRPLQIVLKKAKIKICFEDISSLRSSEKVIFIKEFKEKDTVKGFNLSREISIRASIIKTDEEKYIFILSFHHIILDGWSIPIIFNELMYIYSALKENRPIKFKKVNEYSNYIKWLEKQDKKEALLYWEKYLEDYEQQAQISQLAKSVKEVKYINSDIKFIIDKETTNKLENIARKNKATVNTVFQTIWGILLQRYNNVNDVVFGAIVSGRPAEIDGIENMAGLFINTVPVRIKSSTDKGFIGLLKEVQDANVKSKKYEYVPLAEVQSNTSIKQKLIDNIMVFENYPVIEHNKKLDFKIQMDEVVEQTNYNFNIIIGMTDEIFIKLNYNASIYDDKYVNMIAGHIKHVIKEVSENPEIKISEIDMLSEEEKTKILVEFNDTKAEYPKDKTIHELFEEQVEKSPDNIAVVLEDKKLTYRELNEKANSLARILREKGVEPDSIVGIMVERSLEMMIGIMGILKAGGAYLPIDLSHPKERIEYMLMDSEVKVLLSAERLVDNIEFDGEVIDLVDKYLFKGNLSNLEKVNQSSNLAYIIYTSGTTGEPKGAMIEHFNLNNFIHSLAKQFDKGFNSNDRILSLTNYVFDVSVCEFFVSLISGATLVINHKQKTFDPIEIAKLIVNNQITFTYIPPSLLLEVYENLKMNKRKVKLRKLLVGVEAIRGETLNKFYTLNKDLEIVNGYGPTETTICSTFYKVTKNEPQNRNVLIGRSVGNTNIYILNKYLKIVQVGVVGELFISGDGVSRGYINKQELTDEKFVGNPFKLGTKMYHTEDFARWLPDGNIEFIGRTDNQVKIRGFRIELGEIENQLLKQKNIKEAVVVDRQDNQGNKYLCAYIACDEEMTVAELREGLKKELPEYMIPAYFMQIERMPLTPNGKIDRKALPEPDGEINTGVEYASATNETEEKLVKVWSEVLGVEGIGIDDNFFVLGGHSLKAIQVVSMIHKELNVEVPVGEVFSNTTIRQIGEYISKSKESIYSSIKVVEEKWEKEVL